MAVREKSLREYLPKPEDKRIMHCMVPIDLHAKARKLIKEQRLTWSQFMEGCLRKYCDEMEEK